jgi:hypothetical protein
MREDLLDAYAAVDWAKTQLPILEHAIKAWVDIPPYVVVEEPHPEMGQKLFKLPVNRHMPGTINAGVGAVINSIRSSLDLLAASLARRNGKSPNANRHFPIYPSIQHFIDPLDVAERKKWLSPVEREIIESLQPYEGGDDRLFALHHLDITRKHDRLVDFHLALKTASVSPEAWAQGMGFPPQWPGFKDGAVIAWTSIGATNSDFEITGEITFNEAGPVQNKPVLPTLHQFAGAADRIIQLFERT